MLNTFVSFFCFFFFNSGINSLMGLLYYTSASGDDGGSEAGASLPGLH